jgi:hypothetical protein
MHRWCVRNSDWTIGWHQDGSRERSVNAGAHGPAPLAAVRPQHPYQFNCAFMAWHPETGERRGANRSGKLSVTQASGSAVSLVRGTRAYVQARITGAGRH